MEFGLNFSKIKSNGNMNGNKNVSKFKKNLKLRIFTFILFSN